MRLMWGAPQRCQLRRKAFRHTPLWPAGHLPRKGGDQPSPLPSPILSAARKAAASTQPISPLAGEMSDRTEGGVKGLGAKEFSCGALRA
ncbi:hypothetical protein CK220_10210 [Mesorhizobium sp. WSM3860]|nr:hypothetical protein CK220_10210 [Mesorhizobium sp. WSM3860]